MSPEPRTVTRLFRRAAALVPAALALALAAVPGHADDRELVRRGQDDPYVFILLDVSGSMHQSVNCTQEQFDAGECSMVCPEGACLPRLHGDDPASKMYVAKEAIYEIMRTTENVHFGFATFDQDGLRLLRKHFWYRVKSSQPSGFLQLDSGKRYPDAGHEEVFGQATWNCADAYGTCSAQAASLGLCTQGAVFQDSRYRYIGCPLGSVSGQPTTVQPADLDDPWEMERVRRFPKLDDNNTATRHYYIRDNADDKIYRVTFAPVSGQVISNPTVRVNVTVERCNNTACSNRTSNGTKQLEFERAGEMGYWEPGEGINKVPPGVAFYGAPSGLRNITTAGNENTWDPNTDSGDDPFGGVNIRQDNIADPFGRSGTVFNIGDVIPLDWKNDQRARIMQRMAPNTAVPAGTPVPEPDFQYSTYFNDRRTSTSDTTLKLKDNSKRPLAPDGGTPIGGSMKSFLDWIKLWYPIASNPTTGDPDFRCRNTYLLVITDGLASDGTTSCTVATQLRNLTFGSGGSTKPYPIRSFVVALGLNSTDVVGYENSLSCIAWNGGTGKTPANNPAPGTIDTGGEDGDGDGKDDGPGPLFPQNKRELVDAIASILEEISGQSRSFAAAAVPSVQANAQDKIILSSFTPVNEPIWPGHVNAFIKPVPYQTIQVELNDGSVVQRQVPNPDLVCTGSRTAGCRAWNAGDELLKQATPLDDWADDDFKLGDGEDERRVFYFYENGSTPLQRRASFVLPDTSSKWIDLLVNMQLCDPADSDCLTDPDVRQDAADAVRFLHRIKQYDDPESFGEKIDYLLGDVFHADPVVVGAPAEFRYFSTDLYSESGCGYRCFFRKHRFRRQVLFVGSNDGQLHAIDAGIFRLDEVDADTGEVIGQFDEGTGREVFSYIPRAVLPVIDKASDDHDLGRAQHTFKVDGTPAVADVFIDPNPGDTLGKEWRTVAIGGLREGGGIYEDGEKRTHTGYYALDITQPDVLEKALPTDPDVPNGGDDNPRIPEPKAGTLDYVPSCIDGGADCGPVPYPAVLWEFRDDGCLGGPCDEDLNGEPDLGDTWSTPNIGRIRVCQNAGCDPAVGDTDLFVAVFGGGLDKGKDGSAGNWLYMVEVESGKVVYKRQLEGAAAAEPAAIDTDLDGYFDTIYQATTAGFIYKVNLKVKAPLVDLPVLGPRVIAADWAPYKIFDTEGRPIYYPPTVIYIANYGQYALAVGTGDREDLWSPSNLTGRFYVFLDRNFPRLTSSGSPFTPLRATNLQGLTPTGSATTSNLLETFNGWYLELGAGERAITRPFALSGVTAVTFYQPEVATVGAGGATVVCANTGTSRIFVVNTSNGNGLLNGNKRFRDVRDFVTSPFTEQSQTKNTSEDGSTSDSEETLSPDEIAHLENIRQQLQGMFPRNCKFSNQSQNIKAVRSDTGIEFIAPVPICVIEKNWKGF